MERSADDRYDGGVINFPKSVIMWLDRFLVSSTVLSFFGFLVYLLCTRVASPHPPPVALLCSTSSRMDPQAAATEIFCSKCARSCAADEFEINKQGNWNKTCKRHSQKRSLEFDNWDNFIMLLWKWNKPVSNAETPNLLEPKLTDKSWIHYSNLFLLHRTNTRY